VGQKIDCARSEKLRGLEGEREPTFRFWGALKKVEEKKGKNRSISVREG